MLGIEDATLDEINSSFTIDCPYCGSSDVDSLTHGPKYCNDCNRLFDTLNIARAIAYNLKHPQNP